MSYPAPNYTQAPNALFDLLPEMGFAEMKVTLAIIRQTFGWHRASHVMSLTFLMEATGLSRQGVLDGIEEAMKRGHVQREEDGKSFRYWLIVDGQAARPMGEGTVKQLDAKKETNTSSATANGRQTTLEGEEESTPPARSEVNKRKITQGEWHDASAALARFNDLNDSKLSARTTRGTPSEHIKSIIERLRQHPELQRGQVLDLIDTAFAGQHYWGSGKARVRHIFGEVPFERYLSGDTGSRPTQRRTFAGERPPPKEGPW